MLSSYQGRRDFKNQFENKLKQLLEQKKWPKEGWSQHWISLIIDRFAIMDSNNFSNRCQVGEREGRLLSNIVANRHYRFCHGIGRSGFLTEVQPKAGGSSLLMKITNNIITDAVKQIGFASISNAFVNPLGVDMSLMLCLLMFKKQRNGKYVIWSGFDNESNIKCVLTAGLELMILENFIEGDEVRTDVDHAIKIIERIGADNIICFISTTSCFIPRSPDRLEEIGIACHKYEIPHLINNIYGFQSSKCIQLIQQAFKRGRVDAVVQSVDSFLAPSGGSIIITFDSMTSCNLCSLYPGRASSSSYLDILITILEIGSNGYKKMLQNREENFEYLRRKIKEVALVFGECILHSPNDDISIGMSLQKLPEKKLSFVETMFLMFSGKIRVVFKHKFIGFGSNHSNCPVSYIAVVVTIGVMEEDIDSFIQRLTKVMIDAYGNSEVTDHI